MVIHSFPAVCVCLNLNVRQDVQGKDFEMIFADLALVNDSTSLSSRRCYKDKGDNRLEMI